MDEGNIISATEGARVQAAGVNNLSNVLQGGPINGNSETNSVSPNNYYIGSGETPGVGQPYKDGDKVTLKAQDGEEFSATVDLSQPGGNIKVDNYERYNEANYDPNNLEPKTALYAVPNVAAQTGYEFLEDACSVEGWIASNVWKDEDAAKYWEKLGKGLEGDAQEANEFYRSFAPDKELFDAKTREGMLLVDIAMLANVAKDGVGLTVKGVKLYKAAKVAGKLPKSAEELWKIIMDSITGGSKTVNLWKKSKCSIDELYNYLLKNADSDAANIFLNEGKWPEGIQIPKNSSVLNADGSINWNKAAEGGYTLDTNGKAIKDDFVPKIGEVIDRYGNANGRYTSPVINGKSYSYTQRSLPYVEDLSNYHQYEVTGDFSKIEEYVNNCSDVKLKAQIDANVTKYYDGDYSKLKSYKGGIVEIDGWGIGGGTQYEFPVTVDQLERLGLLKEIK